MSKIRIISIASLFFLIFTFTACNPVITDVSSDSLTKLAETQVTEYQGEKLSSILNFRENSIKGPQTLDIVKYRLTVDGLVDNKAVYTYDEVLTNTKYSKVVTLNCVEGWKVKILWEGIKLSDLFNKAGVSSEANTVIFYAADGYSTSLPLATVLSRDMLLAFNERRGNTAGTGISFPGRGGRQTGV
jgi:DMSO/TMAO reductase YedYZ molybdopterin-dependent catalytic subunit